MNIVGACSDSSLMGILYFIKQFLEIIQIVVPILLMISLITVFLRLVKNPEEKKYLSRIKNSSLAAAIVFFIPVFINILVNLLGDSTDFSSCWRMAEAIKQSGTYVAVEEKERKTIYSDPDEYENGVQIKKITELVYYAQSNYPNVKFCSSSSVAKAGCGAASYAMIASSYSDPSYDPAVVATWFCNNKYNESNGGLLNSAAISSEASNRFGLKVEVLFDKTNYSNYNYGTTYNPTEGNAMLNAVNNGKAVMFGMPKHWSVLGPNPACSNNQFYLYNPGRPTSNGCYTPQELFQYTYNYSNHCSEIGWCGWDIAIAFSN